jgi:hypothetical protein
MPDVTFHRFVDPTYFGAPPILHAAGDPAWPDIIDGVTYDRINVLSGGTGGGGSAFAEPWKASGPNAGTYMTAWTENGTSPNANRAIRALAQNTDYIDNLLHRDLAMPTMATGTGALGPLTTALVMPAYTYVGHTIADDIKHLFDLTDANDDEILDATGAVVQVVSITGEIGRAHV